MQIKDHLGNLILALGVLLLGGVGFWAYSSWTGAPGPSLTGAVSSQSAQGSALPRWMTGAWQTHIPGQAVFLEMRNQAFQIRALSRQRSVSDSGSAGALRYREQQQILTLDPHRQASEAMPDITSILTLRAFDIAVERAGDRMIWRPAAAAHRPDLMHPLFHLNGLEQPILWERAP